MNKLCTEVVRCVIVSVLKGSHGVDIFFVCVIRSAENEAPLTRLFG